MGSLWLWRPNRRARSMTGPGSGQAGIPRSFPALSAVVSPVALMGAALAAVGEVESAPGATASLCNWVIGPDYEAASPGPIGKAT